MKSHIYIDTYNYEEYYLKTYGRVEEYRMTFEELKGLYALRETALNNNFQFSFNFAPCSMTHCIHKSPKGKWIITDCGERREGYICGTYDNIYEACLRMVCECTCYNDNVVAYFSKLYYSDTPKEELIHFACCYGYHDELFYSDVCYQIKKYCGIPVIEDKEVDARIKMRREYPYLISLSFDEMIIRILSDIAIKTKIDIKNENDLWHNKAINDTEYIKILLEKIDAVNKQDLILKELQKYYALKRENVKVRNLTK